MNQNIISYTFTSPICIKNESDIDSGMIKKHNIIPYAKDIENAVTPLLDKAMENFINALSKSQTLLNKILFQEPQISVTDNDVLLAIAMETSDFLTLDDVQQFTDYMYDEFLMSIPMDDTYVAAVTSSQNHLQIFTEPYSVNDIDVLVSKNQEADFEYEVVTPLYGTIYPDISPVGGVYLEGDELLDVPKLIDTLEQIVTESRGAKETLFGLAPYFHFDGAEKLISVKPGISISDHHGWDELALITTVKARAALTDIEMMQFEEDFIGQLSDGWGEWLEQVEIQSADGELYIHPWNPDTQHFYMDTTMTSFPEQENTIEPSL